MTKVRKTEANQWATQRTYGEIIDEFVEEIASMSGVLEIYLVGSAIEKRDYLYDFQDDIDIFLVFEKQPDYWKPIPVKFHGIVHVKQSNQDSIEGSLTFCDGHYEKLK